MFYSINIVTPETQVNTWEDFNLIPTSRPLVSVPEAKIKMVDVPGGNGSLDLTDVLGSSVRYGTRTGSWEFVVANPNITIAGLEDFVESGERFDSRKWIPIIKISDEDTRPWIQVYTRIMNIVHGKKCQVNLTDEPDYWYLGRVKVNEWRSEQMYSTVVLDYELQPFKYTRESDPEKASISKESGGIL